ncbi:MAG: hypothetical protein ABFD69_12545 [Candidatus Sumerlaeia bacterium]
MISLRKLAGILSVMILGLGVAVAQPPADQAPAPPSGGDQAAAPAPGGQGDQAGRRGGRGQFDPAQFQQMMMERQKEQLQATEDEWKVIEPLLSNVMKVRSEMQPMGMRGGRGGRGPGMGGPGGGQGGGQGAVMPERQALQTTLQNQDAKPEDIKAKLDAYKAAMAKKEAELKEARAKLREVLNVRQEAMLVMNGMLD